VIYNALVMDNADFTKTGTIRVRIQNYYMGEWHQDLSSHTTDINEGYNAEAKTYSDFDAYIFSPIGGGQNYGLFILPEINTHGIIAFTGTPLERGTHCFWMGTIFTPTFDTNGNINNINIPSDKISSNGVAADGFISGSPNFENGLSTSAAYDGALVLRLKSTAIMLDDQKKIKSDPLNWEKSNTENLVVLNKDNVLIHHPSAYDTNQKELAYQEINLSSTSSSIIMSSKSSVSDSAKTAFLKLANNSADLSFTLSVNDPKNSVVNSITVIDNSVTIKNSGSNNSTITVGDTGINLKYNNNASISVGNGGEITIYTSGAIHINGGEVRMGTGNARVLTTNSNIKTYNCDNGMVITASDSIFG